MALIDLIRERRSIRRYQNKRIDRKTLDLIAEAGLFAPNAGGRQSAKILMLDDAKLIERIGIVNAACENRNWSAGVSAEQPSIIDDPNIRSGFYGCAALGMVCVPRESMAKVNMIGSAFVCAENMVLEAHELGVSSVIVGRAEATFAHPEMRALLDQWGLDAAYAPIVFVCLGYIQGDYPKIKPRREGRYLYIGPQA